MNTVYINLLSTSTAINRQSSREMAHSTGKPRHAEQLRRNSGGRGGGLMGDLPLTQLQEG